MNISQQGMGKAALLIIAGAVLSRIFGFIRETVIAYQFGATAQTDAFLVASIIPMSLSAMVAGAVAVAFIPVFTEYRLQAGEKEAWIVASTVINFAVLVLVAATLLFILAAPFIIPLLAPGLAPETKSLAVHLSVLIAPALIFNGLVGLFAALLHAYKHFTYPAFAGLLYNFGVIGGVLLLGSLMGITGLVVGTVAGAAAHLLVLTVPLLKQKNFYQLTLRGLGHPGVKRIGLLLLPFAISYATSQVNILVDRIMASGLTEGSISALNFALRVQQLPLGIFAGAAATAAYPILTEQALSRHTDALRRTFSEGLRFTWFIVFPLSVGLIVLSEPVVRLLFERGAFDIVATQMTAVALGYYSLGIFALAANIMLTRVYFACQDTVTPVKLGLCTIGLNIALNLILVGYMALSGLALATSISAMVKSILLAYYLRHRLEHLDGQRILRSTVKIAASSVFMGLIVLAAYNYTLPFFDTALLPHQLLQLGGLVTLGGVVYFGSATLLRTEELTRVITKVGAKLFPCGARR